MMKAEELHRALQGDLKELIQQTLDFPCHGWTCEGDLYGVLHSIVSLFHKGKYATPFKDMSPGHDRIRIRIEPKIPNYAEIWSVGGSAEIFFQESGSPLSSINLMLGFLHEDHILTRISVYYESDGPHFSRLPNSAYAVLSPLPNDLPPVMGWVQGLMRELETENEALHLQKRLSRDNELDFRKSKVIYIWTLKRPLLPDPFQLCLCLTFKLSSKL